MKDYNILHQPKLYSEIEAKSVEIEFAMPSDNYVGSLLRTIITSRPKANLLELGTGLGLSLSWMIDGMDEDSRLTTIDNDPKLIEIARHFFDAEKRVEIVCTDGAEWIKTYKGEKFDLIFADTWPGKYSEIDETLELVKVGGFYIVDDMSLQENWPEGHEEKANKLIDFLDNREDYNLTKMSWSTGIIIASKKF